MGTHAARGTAFIKVVAPNVEVLAKENSSLILQ